MRPFETTEPAPIVAKHCGRGCQIGRIGPIGRLQILISKAAAVWVSTNQRWCKYVCCGISINDAKDEIDIHDLVMFYDEPSHPVQ